MRILITNDDGIHSEGLDVCAEIGRALDMSAPQVGVVLHRLRERSSAKVQAWIDRWEFRQ